MAKDRDALIGHRDTARAYTASTLGHGTPSGNGAVSGNGAPPAGLGPSQDDGRRGRRRLFGRRATPRQRSTAPAEAGAGQPTPGVPAAAPAPDVPAGAPAPAG